MKLTIITVNYNDACGLKRTLQSVKEQTSQDFEYLVIDGGSQDGSKDLLDEYNEIITYTPIAPYIHSMYSTLPVKKTLRGK